METARILIVDDNPEIREIIRILLQGEGYDIEEAKNGTKALEMLELQMFDLIYITTNGGPGKTTTNLPLLLYGVFKSENNYGYANTIGVMIIVLGAIVMVTINKALKVNEEDY